MKRTRLRIQLEATRDLLDNLLHHLPAIEAHFATVNRDGYPNHTPGASAPSTPTRPSPDDEQGVTLTPVEAAGQSWDALPFRRAVTFHRLVARLEDRGKLIALDLAELLTIKDQVVEIDKPSRMCTRGKSTDTLRAREGQIEWADDDCTRVADPTCDGLCTDCFTREQTWRAAHGLDVHTRQAMCIRCELRPETDGRNDHLCNACRMHDSRTRNRAS